MESKTSLHGGAIQKSIGRTFLAKVEVWVFDGETQTKFQSWKQWLYD